MALADVQTLIVLTLENRSFDHLLGFLGLDPDRPAIEGVHADPAWLAAQANLSDGLPYPPHPLGPAVQEIDDPPHDHAAIAAQLTTAPAGGATAGMGGFVSSYQTRQPAPRDADLVMGYYTADAVPMCDFFARNFVVCDHWFAALPTGTQANRLMLMSGDTGITDNASLLIPAQPLVYDWLDAHGIAWCTYQVGDFLPFFALMPSWLPEIAASLALDDLGEPGRFRRYASFREDWNGSGSMPSVIFIEPEYTDGPHVAPNDDHAPTGVAAGQALMRELYCDVISNPQRWARTALIVIYDEHGGFFDHVAPLPIPYANGEVQFDTTGVRVPAFVSSPLVGQGAVFPGKLDHTSLLQLLADRFAPDEDYSSSVGARQKALDRLAVLFDAAPAGPSGARTPAPPGSASQEALSPHLAGSPIRDGLAANTGIVGADSNARAFQNAAFSLARDHADALNSPGWKELLRYLQQPGNGPAQTGTP